MLGGPSNPGSCHFPNVFEPFRKFRTVFVAFSNPCWNRSRPFRSLFRSFSFCRHHCQRCCRRCCLCRRCDRHPSCGHRSDCSGIFLKGQLCQTIADQSIDNNDENDVVTTTTLKSANVTIRKLSKSIQKRSKTQSFLWIFAFGAFRGSRNNRSGSCKNCFGSDRPIEFADYFKRCSNCFCTVLFSFIFVSFRIVSFRFVYRFVSSVIVIVNPE